MIIDNGQLSITMLSKQDKIDIYREMVLIRAFEEKAGEMYKAGNIRGFLHLYIGQEAVASGFHVAAAA